MFWCYNKPINTNKGNTKMAIQTIEQATEFSIRAMSRINDELHDRLIDELDSFMCGLMQQETLSMFQALMAMKPAVESTYYEDAFESILLKYESELTEEELDTLYD